MQGYIRYIPYAIQQREREREGGKAEGSQGGKAEGRVGGRDGERQISRPSTRQNNLLYNMGIVEISVMYSHGESQISRPSARSLVAAAAALRPKERARTRLGNSMRTASFQPLLASASLHCPTQTSGPRSGPGSDAAGARLGLRPRREAPSRTTRRRRGMAG